MIIYQCVPKAARRFIITKLLREWPQRHTLQYYEPMALETPQSNPDELSILFDPEQRPIQRFDYRNLRAVDFCFGVFRSSLFRKQPGDVSFTVLRDPVDKFFSGYYYVNHALVTGTEKSKDGSGMVRYRERYPEMVDFFSQDLKSVVDQFVEAEGKIRFNRNGTIYGPIDELFFYPNNLEQHDFVGVMELMPQTLTGLNRLLGTRLCNDGRINEGPAVPRERYGEKRLRTLFAKDVDTFRHYKGKLTRAKA